MEKALKHCVRPRRRVLWTIKGKLERTYRLQALQLCSISGTCETVLIVDQHESLFSRIDFVLSLLYLLCYCLVAVPSEESAGATAIDIDRDGNDNTFRYIGCRQIPMELFALHPVAHVGSPAVSCI